MPTEAPAADDRRAADRTLLPPLLEAGLLLLVTLVTGVLRCRSFADWPLDAEEIQTLEQIEYFGRLGHEEMTSKVALAGTLFHRVVLFLQGLGADPVAALRLPALACGVAGIPLIHYLVRRRFGPLEALAGSLLVAFSPWHFHLSTHGVPLAVLFLVGIAGLLLLDLAWARSRSGPAILGASLLLAGCGFHRSALLAIVAAVACLALPRRTTRGSPAWVLFLAAIAVLLVPLWAWWSAGSEVADALVEQHLERGPQLWPFELAGSWLDAIGLAPLLLMGIALLAVPARTGRVPRWLVMGCVPLLLLCAASLRVGIAPDLATATLGAWFVLAAIGLAELVRTLAGSRLAQIAVVAMALLPSLPGFVSQLIDNARYDVPAVVASIGWDRQAGEPVFSQQPALTTFYAGVPCRELPTSAEALRQALEATGTPGHVVLLLQRGQAIGSAGSSVQQLVESELELCARVAPKRLDRHRFETRLYRFAPEKP